MTQLNLSGSQNKIPRTPAAEPRREITNQTLGAMGALVVFAAVIIVGSCSQGKKPAAVQQAAQPSAPVTRPAPAGATAPLTPVPTARAAKTRKRRAPILSYVNRDYSVSFSFPRRYQLKTGDALAGPGSMDLAATNFVQPGGTTLAALELPGNSYPGTDFEAAFINLSVNSGMTEQQCSQFASPEANSRGATLQVVKAGANEFTKFSVSDPTIMDQTEAEYYHAFRNGTCYEFAMALATAEGGETGTPQVDRSEVFARLEKILATAKLPAAAAVTTEPAANTAATSTGSAEGETRQNF